MKYITLEQANIIILGVIICNKYFAPPQPVSSMRVPVTETPAPLLSYLVVLVNKLIRQNRWGSHGVFPEITRRFNQYDTNDFDNFIPMSSKNCCYKTGMFLCIVNSSVLSLPLFYHDVRQALNPCSCSSVCATTHQQTTCQLCGVSVQWRKRWDRSLLT